MHVQLRCIHYKVLDVQSPPGLKENQIQGKLHNSVAGVKMSGHTKLEVV